MKLNNPVVLLLGALALVILAVVLLMSVVTKEESNMPAEQTQSDPYDF